MKYVAFLSALVVTTHASGFVSPHFPAAVDGEVRFSPTSIVRSCFYEYAKPVRVANARPYGLVYSVKADACGLFLGGCDEARFSWTVPDCGWRSYRQVYVPTGRPGETREMSFSVGHYRARGNIAFRDFAYCELDPEYASVEGLTLGHGESVVGNRYVFAPTHSERNGGHARPFVSHAKTSLNFPSWQVGRGGEIVFRHELDGRRFLKATVRVCAPNADATNRFSLAVSTDGTNWTKVAAADGAISPKDVELPQRIFPTDTLWVRFGEVEGRGASLDDYQLMADVDGRPVRAFGWTKYRNAATHEVFAEDAVSERGAGIPEGCAWRLAGGEVDLWGAASEVKVFRDSPQPKTAAKELTLRLAGNEWESVQLVVTPKKGDVADVRVLVDDLVCGDARIPFSRIRVERVGYVDVRTPSDFRGQSGLFPDPLLPQDRTRLSVRCGENQPFWITVRTEKGQPPGVYRGVARVTCDGRTTNVPVAVEVFGFDLPDTMSCQSSFGIGRGRFCEYRQVDRNSPQADELTEKHLKFFAEHHLTAQAWDKSLRPRVTWRSAGDPSKAEPVFDWTAFDDWVVEMRGRFDFTTFQFPVEGLGEGFSRSFRPGEICGVKADDPHYEALMAKYLGAVERHLAELGILEKSYAYWYDEPDSTCYGQVDWGMGVLRRHAPGLRRMVTATADKERMGNVNLWCCPVNELLRGDVEGCRARGDGFWWYVCNFPKAPYPTMFTDHAGCPLKTWLWMTWGEGASGVLCWETSYWTRRNAVYPDPKLRQNPYDDAMSWSATAGRWSNGCGRLAYPPLAAVENPAGRPILDGPNGCCRADALRDGLEDYEYFAQLKRVDPKNPLLSVPKDVYVSIVDFNTNPTPMREHRIRLAREIVRLGGGAPRVPPACCMAVRPPAGRDFERLETPAGTVLVAPFDDRIEETLWRFERTEKPLPKAVAVALQLGTHNRGAKPADMAKGMEKLVAAVRRRLPQAKIALYAIFPSAQTWRNFRNRAASSLYETQVDGKAVFFRDINGKLDPKTFSDGLTPDTATRKVWADDIREFVCGGSAVKKLALPALFGDHALLQRAGDTAIWGEASTGREVEVVLGDATARAKADADGWWLAHLDTKKLGDGPFELVVRCGDETLVSKDVVLGELWLSGGQSNMDFKMRSASYGWIFGADAYCREADGRPLRFFRTRCRGGLTPRKGAVSGAWYVASVGSITNASAVSYCFIDAVQREVGGNFGFVDISCGGSRVWQWLSPTVVRSVPELKREYDEQAAARRQGTPEGDWRTRKSICQLYNGTFHPLKDLSCRGVIWYQGENDGELGNDGAETYADWFVRQIESWREDMGRSKLPFYYCQIAGWNGPLREPGGRSGKAAVREGQRRVARRLENVGMAVILQQSEFECHGRDKKPAGERLARIALARTYGKTDLVWRAPDFREMTVADGKARLRFDTFGSALSAGPIRTSYTVSLEGERKGTPTKTIERRSSAASQLEGFDLRDAEGRWHWADARIIGPDTVEVWADGAGRPVEVRYNWGDVAFGNLYDTTGLPVSPFIKKVDDE